MKTLKNILLINGTTSGVTGILLIAMPRLWASIFGTTYTVPFTEVGIFLTGFAIFVCTAGLREKVTGRNVTAIIVLDAMWVAISLIILLFQLLAISIWGYVMIAAVGAWVALMALLQFHGLKRLVKS
jgi:hypothetical protein